MSNQEDNKSDKDQLKKVFLTKAKDSRDLIENNIKEIENRINDLVKAMN